MLERFESHWRILRVTVKLSVPLGGNDSGCAVVCKAWNCGGETFVAMAPKGGMVRLNSDGVERRAQIFRCLPFLLAQLLSTLNTSPGRSAKRTTLAVTVCP